MCPAKSRESCANRRSGRPSTWPPMPSVKVFRLRRCSWSWPTRSIANGGFLMRPYVTRRVVSPQGEVLVENQPHVVRRVISEKTG